MSNEASAFITAYKGGFYGVLRWPQLDTLWETVRAMKDTRWYIYAVGEAPPDTPANAEQLDGFLREIDTLLRKEHGEDYCGVVYADNLQAPGFIKIYDPNNLGSSCGSSGAPPPPPGWILSTLPPEDLSTAFPPPANRRRWWQKLFPG